MADISRRDFLKRGSAALAGMIVAPNIVPNTVLGKARGKKSPSDKLNILGVGIGGRGAADLSAMETENIIGLCDVDWKYAKHVFDKYPKAKRYNDYRKMFDEMLKSADAVMCATADHTHAIILRRCHYSRQTRICREANDTLSLRIALAGCACKEI